MFIRDESVDRFSVSGEDIFLGQEMVDPDVDRFSVSGDTNFPGQEMVNPNEISQSNDKGETLGRRKRTIKPRTLFSPKMKGKTHGDNITTGVGFPQIKKDSGRKGERRNSQPIYWGRLQRKTGFH